MSAFHLRKLISQIRARDSTIYLNYFHILSRKSISSSARESSFTVSYLINSCGFSSEAALLGAKNVHFQTSTTPDSVLKLFENHGFTKTQIKNLVLKYPLVLSCDPGKTLEPKIQFLRQVGLSGPNLAKILSSDPWVLQRSLENQLIPCIDFLKTLLLTDKNVALILNQSFVRFLRTNIVKVMAPKLKSLQDHGVPESSISKLFMAEPAILILNPDRFNELVREITNMGFDPSSTMFILALRVKAGMSNATWKAKLEVFRSFGWSEVETLSAFRKQPLGMMYGEEKIRKALDFFMNKLNCNPSVLSKFLCVIGYNFEKRVIPRCLIFKALVSKGLIKKDLSIGTVIKMSEEEFLKKFVLRFENEASEILKMYQGQI